MKQQTLFFIKIFLYLVVAVLVSRLVVLQIIKGAYYRDLSEGNRIRAIPIAAARGRILAKDKEEIVGEIVSFRRLIYDSSVGYKKMASNEGESMFSEGKRHYSFGQDFAHITGYVQSPEIGEVNKIRTDCSDKKAIEVYDLVGKTGLEKIYDCALAGINGELLLEVDIRGEKVRTLGLKKPIQGKDLITNIDFGLQRFVASVMKDLKGAVIVTDSKGKILSLYSAPSFDPNVFLEGEDQGFRVSLLEDSSLPLFNRAISGLYHPGSTFKMLVSLAALEEGKIDSKYVYQDEGVVTLDTLYGKYSYSNWFFSQYGKTEGTIDLKRAIGRSTDTFFYELGKMLGVEAIGSWSNKLGLDRLSGIDLPGEVSSFIPSPAWKENVKGEKWFLGNTFHISIGQGDLVLTPLGVNNLTRIIANRGKLCKPLLVDEPPCQDLDLKKENFEMIKEGMVQACSSGGTGYTFFDWNREGGPSTSSGRVACKTGTAETVEKGITHAWFTLFAPADNPEIVLTVFVEKGGEGSSVAGPIARKIVDYYFSK